MLLQSLYRDCAPTNITIRILRVTKTRYFIGSGLILMTYQLAVIGMRQ